MDELPEGLMRAGDLRKLIQEYWTLRFRFGTRTPSKYSPHQGEQEMARRRRQMARRG